MATSLKGNLPKFSLAAQKIWVAQTLGGLQPPSPPPPVRLCLAVRSALPSILSLKISVGQRTMSSQYHHLICPDKILVGQSFSPVRCMALKMNNLIWKNKLKIDCVWPRDRLCLTKRPFRITWHSKTTRSQNLEIIIIYIFYLLTFYLGR